MAKAHRPKPSQRKAEPPKPERIIAMTTLPLPRKARPLFIVGSWTEFAHEVE